MLTPHLQPIAAALGAAACLAACGAATPGSSAAATTIAPASSSASPSAAANRALIVALSAGDLPAPASSYTRTADSLLANTGNTDARVFTSPDGNVKVEVDVAVDTNAGAAAGDYTAFDAAAAKQVPQQTGTSTPSIGSKANEYVGTDASGSSAVSVAFVQGSVIVVVTEKATGVTVDPAATEAIATAQAARISSAGL
jgi:hypothetical protein